MDGNWLSTDDLITRVGGGISRSRVERWLKAGLLPKPRRRGLGRGRGTVSLYPPVAMPMLQRLVALQKETPRDIDEWRWRLWLDGYPIDLEKLQGYLLKTLDAVEVGMHAELSQLQPDEPDELGLIEAWLSTAAGRDNRLARRLRWRLSNQSDWQSLMAYVMSLALGYVPPVSWEEPVDEGGQTIKDLFERAADVPLAGESVGILPDWFSIAALHEAIVHVSPEEWRALRRDWQAITGAVASMEYVFQLVEHAQMSPDDLDPEDAATATQIRRDKRSWLGAVVTVTRDPDFRAMLSGLLLQVRRSNLKGNLETVMAALRFFAATIN